MTDQAILSNPVTTKSPLASQSDVKGKSIHHSGGNNSGGGSEKRGFSSPERAEEACQTFENGDISSKGTDRSAGSSENGSDFDEIFRLLSSGGDGTKGAGSESAGLPQDLLVSDGGGDQAIANPLHGQGKEGKAVEVAFSQLLNAAVPGEGKGQNAGGDNAGAHVRQNGGGKQAMLSRSGEDVWAGEKAGKAGVFDAYSVETRSISAFDRIIPIVKKSVLNPLQKAMRDDFSIVRQETHFAPVASLEMTDAVAGSSQSILKQIGTAVAKNLSSPPTDSMVRDVARPSMEGGSFRVNSRGEALRVLDIQLHPADLGKVRLSIRLNDTTVDVRVEASNAATAKMLDGNRGALDQMLQRAGYRADQISVVAVDEKNGSQIMPPSSSNQSGGANSGQSGSQPHGQGGQGTGTPGNGAQSGSQSGTGGEGANHQQAQQDQGLAGEEHHETIRSTVSASNLSDGITL